MLAASSITALFFFGTAIFLSGCGNKAPPKPNDCVTLPRQWTQSNGEYIDIVQEGCDVIATNPVEMWSPAEGTIINNTLYIFNDIGNFSDNKVTWKRRVHDVWFVLEAPPLEVGLAEVRQMLQFAIKTEQSVIQPYLQALYSMEAGTNVNATALLHGLCVEEMFHMTTASNVLNAIGGHPIMNTEGFVPVYPMKLPYVNYSISLKPFSTDQMGLFKRVEEATWGPDNNYRLNTVGVYYFRIRTLLDKLVQSYGEAAIYVGDPKLQVKTTISAMGSVPAIYNHFDAMNGIAGIYLQGEGVVGDLYDQSYFNNNISQLSHYYRFNELLEDRCYMPADNHSQNINTPTGSSLGTNWTAVFNSTVNPKANDFAAHPEIYKKMAEFNACYSDLLVGMHNVFNGSPEKFQATVTLMKALGPLAKALMAIPHPDKPGMTVGPAWEWIDTGLSSTPPCPAVMLSTDIVV